MSKVKIGDFLFERQGRYKPNDESISNLKRISKIDFHGNFHIGDKDSNTDMILIKKGDLVISGINIEKGAMGIYTGKEDIVATIHYSSYTFDENQINLEYFKRFLKSPEFKELINEQVKGGIKTEIKPKHILPLIINLPDLTTQNTIVKYFENIEDDIRSLDCEIEKQQALLKKFRQSILQDAIEGKLTKKWREENLHVESASILLEKIQAEKVKLIQEKKIKKQEPLPKIREDEIPFDILQSWVWCRFGEIATIESNLVNPKDYLEYYQIGPDLIEKNTGKLLESRTVKESGMFSSNHYFFKNQLIYSKVRPKLNKVIIADYDGLCSADMYPIQSFIYNKYLQIVMLSEHFYWEVDKFDNRVKMPKINQNQLNVTKIPTPPLEEQKEIVSRVKKLFAICNELEAQINKSKTNIDILTQAILKEAFEK